MTKSSRSLFKCSLPGNWERKPIIMNFFDVAIYDVAWRNRASDREKNLQNYWAYQTCYQLQVVSVCLRLPKW